MELSPILSRGGGQSGICQEFANLLLSDAYKNKAVDIKLEAKGRPEIAEKMSSGKCANGLSCYFMPFPALGDAGKNCDAYKPLSSSTSTFTPPSAPSAIDNADYACNWNKLTYGSNAADRVAIPLYYDSTKIGETGSDDKLIYPYYTKTATSFTLRIRTPCDVGTDGTRPNYCPSRPVLNTTDGDDIVVQWQLNGLCGTQACGMIADPENKTNSAISESAINKLSILIQNVSVGLDINSNSAKSDSAAFLPSSGNILPTQLDKMTKPILTLFLSKGLTAQPDPKDATPKNIPYLEYQVLTDYPTANSREVLTATVTVDGNTFKKTLTKEIKKPLIDFAVQN